MKSLCDEVLHRRGSIAKGDGVVVICRGDSRIAREMFTCGEREITQRGCARYAHSVRDMFAMRTLYHFEGRYSAALITFPFGEGGPLAVDEVNFYHSNISQPHPSCFASHLPQRGRLIHLSRLISRLRARSPRGKTILNRFLTLSVSLRYPRGKVIKLLLRKCKMQN